MTLTRIRNQTLRTCASLAVQQLHNFELVFKDAANAA